MNNDEFKRINDIIHATINGMTPMERAYHDIKVGIQFHGLLSDYNWDRSIFDVPVEQMKMLQSSSYNRSNIECRIPIWLDKWDTFNYPTASPAEREAFEKEATDIRYAMALYLGDHPANGRILRWVMSIFDEEKRCFRYDQMQS